MTASQTPTIPVLDRPDVLMLLFHPRSEPPGAYQGPAHDVMIPVAPDVAVGGRFHMQAAANPNLLFFHGNGEIVSDYDELGPVYNARAINLLAVDYRGYGRSSGHPTVSAMLTDSHTIFAFAREWLPTHGYTGPLILMGRSLGSAAVLELAASYPERIAGLIVESGFARAAPLLRLLGIDPDRIGFREAHGFRNIDKIKSYKGPTLIIHAEFDHIIPYSDGEALWAASPATHKRLLQIQDANHNDIFLRGMQVYLEAVDQFSRLGREASDSAAG
ncbi:MAG: alpha/beta fold hydrolase [Desulfosarcina sp.]|nr:alpha/beta fold hydrolase [Desulfobacterales bacterium]